MESHGEAEASPSFADGERLILFPSVAPCVRFRPRFTLSHRLRRWLRPPSLAAPLPTQSRFSFRSSFAPLRSRYSTSGASSSNGCHVLRTPFPPKKFYSPITSNSLKNHSVTSCFHPRRRRATLRLSGNILRRKRFQGHAELPSTVMRQSYRQARDHVLCREKQPKEKKCPSTSRSAQSTSQSIPHRMERRRGVCVWMFWIFI